MPELGYACLSEQHEPDEMVEYVADAERRGVDYAMVSDHYHPWTTAQGESPFVWGVLGAIAHGTERIPVGTAVTAPIIRIHPAVVAQAAATAATQLDGRFIFGVGTGERLNEHVTGERWPPHDVRLEKLEEAIEIIRLLWEGGEKTYRGDHFTVENARVFTLPDELPPVVVAAGGETSAAAAGHYGDGLMSTSPDEGLVDRYEEGNEGETEPHFGQFHACYAEDEDDAIETALETWPNAAMAGELGRELATPAHYEQTATMVDREDIAEQVVCGPDADDFIEKIEAFVDSGFESVHVHQIGQQQEEFLEFYEEEVMPSF
ncbi:TIGR03557 family F420-dependent LLM class oxidoreductase [Natronomonas salina]|uniref:TIGR03557 family F420-dependent LLM class oxidoreductase n=1 Tax=Natronomonas salina TaxID=1710540 RepID=UPI0015B58ECF|nr:TIGR03557 family F420-dependent LLM class oxidoreductase [Natronomonas salina]QLD91015.1 TIGR03557 family F420-dependent LLM class oxidoreductase [Natronomonas salina]